MDFIKTVKTNYSFGGLKFPLGLGVFENQIQNDWAFAEHFLEFKINNI